MERHDADLFLNWAADEFLAAGRAAEDERRRAHRRQAELFCDIFHALNESAVTLPAQAPRPRALIGELLDRAFKSRDATRR